MFAYEYIITLQQYNYFLKHTFRNRCTNNKINILASITVQFSFLSWSCLLTSWDTLTLETLAYSGRHSCLTNQELPPETQDLLSGSECFSASFITQRAFRCRTASRRKKAQKKTAAEWSQLDMLTPAWRICPTFLSSKFWWFGLNLYCVCIASSMQQVF